MRVKREKFISPLTVEGYRIRLTLSKLSTSVPKPVLFHTGADYVEMVLTRTGAEQIHAALNKELYGEAKSESS